VVTLYLKEKIFEKLLTLEIIDGIDGTMTTLLKTVDLQTRNLSLPKHKRVIRKILGYIKQNDLKPGDKMPGERTLAKMFGVSPLTIGKGLTRLVEQDILLRQVGSGTYIAKSPAAKEMLSVCRFGLITRYYEDDLYIIEVQRGFNQALAEADIERISLYQNSDTYLFNMQQYDLMGIAVITPLESSIKELVHIKSMAPLAIIGTQYESFEDITYSCDDKNAMCEATKYLASLGHKKIAILTAAGHHNLETRLRGYHLGMFEASLPVHPDWLITSHHYDGIGVDKEVSSHLAQILKVENAPTAVVASSPSLLLTAFRTAEALKMEIPSRLSIIGMDEIPKGQYVCTAPTTMVQPLEEIGYAAGKHLVASFRSEPIDLQHLHQPRLVIRNSCCPPGI